MHHSQLADCEGTYTDPTLVDHPPAGERAGDCLPAAITCNLSESVSIHHTRNGIMRVCLRHRLHGRDDVSNRLVERCTRKGNRSDVFRLQSRDSDSLRRSESESRRGWAEHAPLPFFTETPISASCPSRSFRVLRSVWHQAISQNKSQELHAKGTVLVYLRSRSA